jgi:hypothetical protein
MTIGEAAEIALNQISREVAAERNRWARSIILDLSNGGATGLEILRELERIANALPGETGHRQISRALREFLEQVRYW